jgi:hypothetical protein
LVWASGSDEDLSDAAVPDARCPEPQGQTAPEGPYVDLAVLQAGGATTPEVRAAVYPRPEHEGSPWSHWGQGLVLPDGRYWSAIGDHLGADGNSYFFDYDPATSRLTRFGDVLTNVEHQPGAWGFGKVHGQLVPDPCGHVWAATYWGSRRGLTFGDGYEGDLLLRIDPATFVIDPQLLPVPLHGIPSIAGTPDRGLLFGEAVEPETDDGRFFVVDTLDAEVVWLGEVPGHTMFRNVLVAEDGRAHLAVGDGRLAVYDPDNGEVEATGLRLTGERLRASTQPDGDGTVYGATREPDRFFALDPDGSVRDLGPARGYVASLALHPDGGGFVYVPGAHGSAWEQGTPLFAVDGRTGEHQTIVELHDPGVDAFGLRLGGTYSVATDPQARRVFVTLNAGEAGEESFGVVVLVVVELP